MERLRSYTPTRWEIIKAQIGVVFDDFKDGSRGLRDIDKKAAVNTGARVLGAGILAGTAAGSLPAQVVRAQTSQEQLELASRLAIISPLNTEGAQKAAEILNDYQALLHGDEIPPEEDTVGILGAAGSSTVELDVEPAVDVPVLPPSGESLSPGAVKLANGDLFIGTAGWGFAIPQNIVDKYQEFGGSGKWGDIISGSWKDEIGRTNIATERGIFQFTKSDDGTLLTEWFNVFDVMNERGLDQRLVQKVIPRVSIDWAKLDVGKPWGHTPQGALPGTVEKNHIDIIFSQVQAYPQLKDAYLSDKYWFEKYGLPVAAYENEYVVVVRFQRAAMQLWKNQTPWTEKPGEITWVLAGTEAKQAGLIPGLALHALSLREAQAQAEKELGIVDVLGLKSWDEFDYKNVIKHLPYGLMQVSKHPNSTEDIFGRSSDVIKVSPKGFETLFKIYAFSADPSMPARGYIVMNNISNVRTSNSLWPLNIRIGIDNDSNLKISYWDLENPNTSARVQLVVNQNIKLSSGELRVEVIGSGLEERWNFYDGATGNLLVGNIKMPRPFLLPDRENEIYPGFYVVSGSAGIVATLSVDYWKISPFINAS